MEKRVRGVDAFLPWLESAGLVIYCCLMVRFNMYFQPSLPVALLFFLPLAGFELYLSIRYEKGRLLSARGIIFLFPRILFLFLFFYLWSVLFLQVMHRPPLIGFSWTISHAPMWIQEIKLILYARPKIVFLMLMILFLGYYIFFLRLRKGRFFISIFLPWLFFFILLFVFFYHDTLGGISKKKVESQPDVKIFFPYPSSDFATGRASDWLSTFKFPRVLRIDEERKKLYLSFGSTFGNPSNFPNFLEIDIKTQNYRALRTQESPVHSEIKFLPGLIPSVIRDFGYLSGSGKLYLTRWDSYLIYGISKKDFKVIEKIDIPRRAKIKQWEPYCTFYNHKTKSVYIANGQDPLLIKYCLESKEVEVIDLVKEGIAGIGSFPIETRFSSTMDRIYVLLLTDRKGSLIVEFETSPFRPVRIIKMPDLAIFMEVDEENKRLLVTSAFGRELWEIDLGKFEIIKKIDIPSNFCRKILIDNSNNLLYCLDYLRGRLFLIDRDSGKIYRRYWVGNKPLGLVKFGERIFVSSTLGIIEIKPDLTFQDRK